MRSYSAHLSSKKFKPCIFGKSEDTVAMLLTL